MHACNACSSDIKVSICIPTFNRAHLIGATLDSILMQITDECEIVISDNASTDSTYEVVSEYMLRSQSIRYNRNEFNIGPDRNYDRAVAISRGDYCWLMTDDDILKPGAIWRVLAVLNDPSVDYSVIAVNAEKRNFDLSELLLPRIYDLFDNRVYHPECLDDLAVDSYCLIVVCCLILKREIWIKRSRDRYIGSMFLHVAVVFQKPLPSPALIIADALIVHRDGHPKEFWSDLFEIVAIKWPSLLWSFPLATDTKEKLCPEQPWNRLSLLIHYRGMGWYTFAEYRSLIRPLVHLSRDRIFPALIALLPGYALNSALYIYYSLFRPCTGGLPTWKVQLLYLRLSPYFLGKRS